MDLESEFIEDIDQDNSQGRGYYFMVCKNFGLIFCILFFWQFGKLEMNFKYYNFGLVGVEVVVVVLMQNMLVLILNIFDNLIGVDGVIYIVKMFIENLFIIELDVLQNDFCI